MHVTTLFTQLEAEWGRSLATITTDFGPLGLATGDEIRERIQTVPACPGDRNALLRTLLELDRAGHPTAARVVLQAFMPLAFSCARRYHDRIPRSDWHEACQAAVTTLWDLIKELPATRFGAISGNLKMDLWKRLSAQAAAECGMVERQMSDEWWIVNAAENPGPQKAQADGPKEDITVLLTWAADQRLLTRDQIELLARVELSDSPATIHATLCDELRITRHALNKRLLRIRQTLMRAAAATVAAEGA